MGSVASAPTTNSPTSRGLWSPGFGISNDTDSIWPNTGVTRQYTFNLAEAQCNPDGHGAVECMTVNGSPYVGPTIFADWGDMVSITINNGLTTNGTSIHYHGMNMPNNNVNDGVNGVTECALAPGTSITHTWQATQHGTSWWHSHYTGQYAGGIQGPIVIDGPTSANYDIDLGALPLTDWQYVPAFTEAYVNEQRALNFQGILAVDNILINGTAQDGNGNGAYSTINVTAGKVHKLRLINTSVSTGLLFQIAGHSMTVVAQDFVPVTPLNVTQLSISIGQRYDVLVTADQSPGAYWVRADGDSDCQEPTNRGGRAVLVYSTSPSATPDTAEPDGANVAGTCTAPATEPVWTVTAGSLDDFTANRGYLTLTLGNQVQSHNGDFIDWYFNTTGIDINWGHPTLTYIAEGNTSYPAESAAIPLNATASGWSYWVIYELGNPGTSFIPHPLHLHGHDFWLLGQGVGAFDLATASLNFDNPLRRDTHVLQGDNHTQQGVWMAFAFRTGNPGAWLFHCHIAQHISAGFGVQFLDTIESVPAPPQSYNQQCDNWNSYYATVQAEYLKNDSGL